MPWRLREIDAVRFPVVNATEAGGFTVGLGLPGEYRQVAYITTGGGAVSPPPDGVRSPAKLLAYRVALGAGSASFLSAEEMDLGAQ